MDNLFVSKYFNDEDEMEFFIRTEIDPKGITWNSRVIRIDGEITGYELQYLP